jgi:Kef-type K+ transport system membrane component KefB
VLAGLEDLFVVAIVFALAPIASALFPARRLPQLVILIAGGVLVGPDGLGLVQPDDIALIANVGLGFVFLQAGYEIEPRLLRSRIGALALIAWVMSAVIATGAVGVLASFGYVHAFVPVALALTTSALGTVLPILRERGQLDSLLGRLFLANSAVGEVLPIIAIAIFLGVNSRFTALLSFAAIGLIALSLAVIPKVLPRARMPRIVIEPDGTSQTTLRWALLLLLGLLVLAGKFGLDVVLGAMLAGMVLRKWATTDTEALERKLDALGHGFFVPVFFVSSGMALDLDAIVGAPLRMVVFLILILAVRGIPLMLMHRGILAFRQRAQLMFYTATTLPLIVALTGIGVSNGTMLTENAAALVGAAVLTVVLFPLAAGLLDHRKR